MNRRSLIKLASQQGYDLSTKFKDEKGNPKKGLVPLDLGRTKPLAKHEVTAKMPPKSHDVEKPKNKYPYSGFDYYTNTGAITPIKDHNIDSKEFKQDKNAGTLDFGLMDINKVLADQLGGGPLAEATANALAEYARQKRYNSLSSHDKRRYDTIASKTGIKPHAITMTVPSNFDYILKKNLPAPQGVDPKLWDSNKVLRKKGVRPVLYNSKNGKPTFPEGSVALNPLFFRNMFKEYSPYKKLKPGEEKLESVDEVYSPSDSVFAKNYMSGVIPISRENFSDQFLEAKDNTRGPQTLLSLLTIDDKRGTTSFGPGYIADSAYRIPGINLENRSLGIGSNRLYENDYLRSPEKDYYNRILYMDDKATADHEAIHAMNNQLNSDITLGYKRVDDAKLGVNADRDLGFALSDWRWHGTGDYNGFFKSEPTYFNELGEGLRSLATALRGYQNHLKEVLPAQMEARGELKGLNEKERNDKIGWRIAELSHDGDNYINYLRELGLLDGIPGNWRVPVSSLGGISGREMNRALEGIDKVTAPKEKLLELVRPEDKEGKDLESYDSVSEEYIRQVLPYLLQNDYSDVNQDGSVLA